VVDRPSAAVRGRGAAKNLSVCGHERGEIGSGTCLWSEWEFERKNQKTAKHMASGGRDVRGGKA